MLTNLSVFENKAPVNYPIFDSKLPFARYLSDCRNLIENRRMDLVASFYPDLIIDANAPYEFKPKTNDKPKIGALLLHGLFDCPFSLKDLAYQLCANDILCRSILLPGHGTNPADLLTISYHDWIQAVRYGVESMQEEVDQLYLVGYSTGAALAIHHALQNTGISGLILLAPAVRIKAPVDMFVSWHKLMSLIAKSKPWVCVEDEIDYTKYRSVPLNAVSQISQLTEVISQLHLKHEINCPIFMAISREDETISSHTAMDFFTCTPNSKSKLLVYSSIERLYPDKRIQTKNAVYPDLRIHHFSHIGLPFAPDNLHYGQQGDFKYASRLDHENYSYGAYNKLEVNACNLFQKLGLLESKRRELTYNPDFYNMSREIVSFLNTVSTV